MIGAWFVRASTQREPLTRLGSQVELSDFLLDPCPITQRWFANTHAARRLDTGDRVVVHMLRTDAITVRQCDFLRDLREHRRRLQKHALACVSPVIAHGCGSARAFVVEPQPSGRALRDWLPVLTQMQRVRIAQRIAMTLDNLHAVGMVHGSLCPLSIYVDADGAVVLTQSGLSSLSRVAPNLARSFFDDTPYLAPELLNGAAAPSRAGDIYAFAAVIKACGAADESYRVATSQMQALQHELDRALSVRQADRPETAAQLIRPLLSHHYFR